MRLGPQNKPAKNTRDFCGVTVGFTGGKGTLACYKQTMQVLSFTHQFLFIQHPFPFFEFTAFAAAGGGVHGRHRYCRFHIMFIVYGFSLSGLDGTRDLFSWSVVNFEGSIPSYWNKGNNPNMILHLYVDLFHLRRRCDPPPFSIPFPD